MPIALAYVSPAERYPPGWKKETDDVLASIDDGVKFEDTWHAMEAMVDEGLVHNIGLSNCKADKVIDVMKYARIKPAVLQVEMHPFLP